MIQGSIFVPTSFPKDEIMVFGASVFFSCYIILVRPLTPASHFCEFIILKDPI